MNKPLVDVVIITYNQEDFIAETLESVLSQSYENIRIIVSDDGSKDKTPEIINNYAQKYKNIVPVFSKKNTGIAANLNRAIKHLQGKYVAWLGGDDLFLPDKIKIQVEFLESNPHFSGCFTDAEVFEHPSGKVLGLFSKLFGNGKIEETIDIRNFLNPKIQLLPSTFLIRKKYIPPHGFDTRFAILNDFIFDAEVVLKAPFGGIPNVLTKYRRHTKNIGKNETFRKKIFEENLMAIAVLESRYPFLSKYLKKRKNYYILLEALKSFNTDKKRAKILIRNAIYNGDILKAIGCYILGSWLSKYIQDEEKRKFLAKLRKIVY
ncbi:glycosyltransferase family 2 protein [Persephonella sp.]